MKAYTLKTKLSAFAGPASGLFSELRKGKNRLSESTEGRQTVVKAKQ